MDSIDEGVWAEAGSHQNIREVRGGKQSLEIRGCQSEESVQGTAARARTHTHIHTHTHTHYVHTYTQERERQLCPCLSMEIWAALILSLSLSQSLQRHTSLHLLLFLAFRVSAASEHTATTGRLTMNLGVSHHL